jgi:glycosyltransferase involved in cell wall biosynthesis
MINQKELLFVVHRYYPYPGGSEYYVQNMAEEAARRGHKVTVLTQTHDVQQGKHKDVWVTSDFNAALNAKWDLIIVHGGDVNAQNVIHAHSFNIKSPILYMIIKPSDSEVCVHGMKNAEFLACSTSMDWNHIKKYGLESKGRRVRHGIDIFDSIGGANLIGSEEPFFVSAGGYWPHKGMQELADAWEASSIDAKLILFGYGAYENMPEQGKKVFPMKDVDKHVVMHNIAASQGYIMNSYEEGFGLVLLEAMLNRVPWFARDIAAAHDLEKYGHTYSNTSELIKFLESCYHDDDRDWWNSISMEFDEEIGFNYVMQNHTIKQTVDDIEDVLLEIERTRW